MFFPDDNCEAGNLGNDKSAGYCVEDPNCVCDQGCQDLDMTADRSWPGQRDNPL